MELAVEMEETVNCTMFNAIPIRALHVSCRRELSMALNREMPLLSNNGYPRNWQGLIELIGYSYDMVKLLRQREDPTTALLEFWEADDSNPTVAKLLECLKTIERFDVIHDILPLLERDAKSYLGREEARKRRMDSMMPIQDASISSGQYVTISLTRNDVMKTQRQAAIGGAMQPNDPGAIDEDRYDAYVSYVDSDIDFVYTLIEKLEGEFHLKLFIKGRDLLAGIVESEADLKMIHERCERILLIISPEFLSDPQCEFTTMFAQALAVDNHLYARKVIPVICKPCELPVRLKYIARVDYTKRDFFGKFWERLFCSIKNPIQGELPMVTTGIGRLSPNHLLTESSSTNSEEMTSTSSSGCVDTKEPNPIKAIASANFPTMPEYTGTKPTLTVDGVCSNSLDSGIELQTISNIQLSVKETKAKGSKKSPPNRRKFFHSSGGFFSRGPRPNANTE